MSYAPISKALREQLAATDPDWLNESVGLDALRQRTDSRRSYMTVDEGINHFRRWTQHDREIARQVAEYTDVTMAYVIPSEAYLAFLTGGHSTIRFTASLGVIQGGRISYWDRQDDDQVHEVLPGVTRIELSQHRSSESDELHGHLARARVCTRCFLELPLSSERSTHDDC